MKITKWFTSSMRVFLLITLFIGLLGTSVACEGLGLSPSDNSGDNAEPESTVESGPVTVNTKDAAVLAVYRHLLGKAENYSAKSYLADFYTSCDNWYAESEYFKDGSDVWNVVVDMTDESSWNLRSYWQQASWFILNDGEVIPSNLFESNALRIEADLQEFSTETTMQTK